MRDTTVLVVGSQMQALPVLRALRARGFRAWSDVPEHVASDGVSLAWADALVVIENDRYEHPPAITDFTKPRLLAISTPLDDAQLVALLADGFDAVLPWPSSPDEIAARLVRLARLAPRAASGGDSTQRVVA